MNPDQPSREQIEARMTALLLGELPPAEAEVLRWTISRDPELQKLHDQLKVTIGFVRDAMKNPTGAPLERETPLKLPQERRQTLLAHFKTARPRPPRKLSWLKQIEIPHVNRWVEVAIVVFIIGALAAMLLPVRETTSTRSRSRVPRSLPANQYLGMELATSGKKATTHTMDGNAQSLDTARKRDMERNSAAPANSLSDNINQSPKRSPQEPTTTPTPPAHIALPNESSNRESEENGVPLFSQNVVGYVNVAPPATVSAQVPNQLESQPKTDTTSFGRSASSPPPSPQAQTAAPFAQGGMATQPSALSAPAPAEVAENVNADLPSAPPPSTAPAQLAPPPITASDEGAGEGNGQPVSVPHENRSAAPILGELSTVGGLPASKEENPSDRLALMPPRLREQYAERNGALISAQAPVSLPFTSGSAGIASDVPASAAPSQLQPILPVPIGGTYKVYVAPPDSSSTSATNYGQPANGSVELNRELSEAMQNLQSQTKSVSGATGSGSSANQNGFIANYSFQASAASTTNAIAMDQSKLQNALDYATNGTPWAGQYFNLPNQSPAVNQATTPMAPSQQQYAQNLQTLDKDRITELDMPLAPAPANQPVPQPEIQTTDNAFSTFSLNVSDVSFKLAMASLQKGQMPAPTSIRSEEFINAFDYHDPEPLQGEPLAFMYERASDPFAHERDFLRFSIKAAAAGRQEGRALNLVLLLDTSGSMERADRVAIIREMLSVLSSQLLPHDVVSVVTFARAARLWADGVPGDEAGSTLDKVGSITPEGGTNLEEAMRLAYETALRHFIAGGMNRVVLLTDGAANLGNVDPQALTQKVHTERRQGIALDCFGIGWDDYNDDLLEQLSSNGDGRYAFINSPDEAATEFATKLAGALQVAAEDVKVQVEFNPNRVTTWRQIGYVKHQLTKQQFRDNTVAAGAIAAREAGNALYVIETNPNGEGPIATVRVRYRVPGTQVVNERSWSVVYAGAAPDLAQSSPAMRLAATAAKTAEWLSDSPFAQDVTPDELLNDLSGVPQVYGTDERPKQLEWMIREAKSVSGK